MKLMLLPLCIASLLSIVPLASHAQDDERSCGFLLELLEQGAEAQELVRATVASGLALPEATVFAMVCAGEESRVAIATAGIEQAESLVQAQLVASAVLASAGPSGPVADAVELAMASYAQQMPQPDGYRDEYTPTGRGVSPAV